VRACDPWTGQQIAILKANWLLPDAQIKALVDQAGPKRSVGAVRERRRSMGLIREPQPTPGSERVHLRKAPPRKPDACDLHLIALARALAEQEAA